MRKLEITELVQHYCKLSGKWAVVLCTPEESSFADLQDAANFLTEDDCQAMTDGLMIVMCDSEDEHWTVFNSIVGDDGPSDLNSYNGPCRIYAWTCGPDGDILTENT